MAVAAVATAAADATSLSFSFFFGNPALIAGFFISLICFLVSLGNLGILEIFDSAIHGLASTRSLK
jgi:hypothetical protein